MKKIIAILLCSIAALLTACQIKEPDKSHTASQTQRPQDYQESTSSNISPEDSIEYKFASEIYHNQGEELVRLVNQRVESFRDGSFVQIENHPVPQLPPASIKSLPQIKTLDDFRIVWRAGRVDGDIEYPGIVLIVAEIDDDYAIALHPFIFVSIESDMKTLGLETGGIANLSSLGHDNFESWLKNLNADGIIGA